jgi:hypothetical protein
MASNWWAWSKSNKSEPVAPMNSRQSAEEIAARALELAVSELSAIMQEYRAMQRDHDLLLDSAGNMLRCSVPDFSVRDQLEIECRDLVRRHTSALEKFNQRAREYAGLKGTKNAANN